MGYQKIPNLYKDQRVLMFKKVYCLEKIHGTSAHISWNPENSNLHFFPGGEKHERFIKIFDKEFLARKFSEVTPFDKVVIFGEAYGGKCQGMSETYGTELKFCVFEVRINNYWLNVEKAEKFIQDFNLEFVDYELVDCTLENLNRLRDKDSTQAIRNGIGPGKKREGIVIRPPFEVTTNNGERVVAKHKRDDFRETKTPRKVSPEKLKVLTKAQDVADEWVTEMRLTHVIDKIPDLEMDMSYTKKVISAMINDIKIEGEGEIEWNKYTDKEIAKKTANIWKKRVVSKLGE